MSYSSIGEGSSSSKQHFLEDNSFNRKGKEREKYPANTLQEDSPLILPPTTTSSSQQQPYGAINDQQSQDVESSSTNRRQQKTCTYIAISITLCGVVALFLLLWFAPTFAERSVKDGVGFSFSKASILNVTADNVITMHVVGKIELQDPLFNLQHKFNSLFGTIGIRDSQLDIYYQKKQEESSMSAFSSSMGKIDLPALDLNSSSSVTGFDFISQFVIQDTNALMEFCKDAVVAETIMWRVAGPLAVNLGRLPWKSNVELDKTIELEGELKFMQALKKQQN
jgi:hypothetical protein